MVINIIFLRGVKIAIKSGIKSWFGVMGFSTSNYILGLIVFFLTRCRKKPLIKMGLELDL